MLSALSSQQCTAIHSTCTKMSETPSASAPKASEGSAPPSTSAAAGETSDVSTPGCPICEFIEAGPCGDQHKVWVSCRGEAKDQDVDFVAHCADTFRSFFGCMLSHQDYYRPFLDAFHVDTDLSQEAIDKANARKQQEEQQQQQQQEAGPAQPPLQPHHQQQQQSPLGAASKQSADEQAPAAVVGGSSSKQAQSTHGGTSTSAR